MNYLGVSYVILPVRGRDIRELEWIRRKEDDWIN